MVDSVCQIEDVHYSEQKKFGYSKKAVLSLSNILMEKEIEFPDNSKLTCKLEYTDREWDQDLNDTMLVKVSPHYSYSYDKETGKINKVPIQAGNSYQNMMQLLRGYPDTMRHIVHELTQNYINANGKKETTDKFYFSGSTLNFETPYVNQTDVDETIFTAYVDFYFDF